VRYAATMLRALAIAALVLATACKGTDREPPATGSASPEAKSDDHDSPAIQRARAAAGSFKVALKKALTGAMSDGGPAKAIEVCSHEAPRLAAAASHDGITHGRATTKTRNPKNRATGWQADAIARFESLPQPERANARFTRTLDDGATAYAEPLIAQGLCLVCHGTAVAGEVATALASRYPEDQATGYAEGDLRGVVWVEVR